MRQTTTTKLSVTAYAARIERAVLAAGGAVVEGEVQNVHTTPRGLLYFTLTDGDSELPCKVFPRDARRLKHPPKDGDLVTVVIDRPDYWKERARLTVIVSEVRLAGEGELLVRREELLAKLRAEGFCDPDRFKPVPRFPRAVGVIAGSNSHGMADVVTALQERFPPVRIVTCTSLVQGKAAPNQLIAALARLDMHPLVDAIILARGGGSVADLVAFDDERLCKAIFACRTPVVTAVGHTNNNPVCNYVTHAAPTPSRSPEWVVPSVDELRATIGAARLAIGSVPAQVETLQERLSANRERLRVPSVLEARSQAVREHARTIASCEQALFAERASGLSEARVALSTMRHRAREAFGHSEHKLDEVRGRMERAGARLEEVRLDVAELIRQVVVAAKRQAGDHARDYGRALARLVKEARKSVLRGLERQREPVDREAAVVAERVSRGVEASQRDLAHITALIEARDFHRHGYVLAADDEGLPVRSVADIGPGTGINLRFRDGQAHAVVDDVKEQQ